MSIERLTPQPGLLLNGSMEDGNGPEFFGGERAQNNFDRGGGRRGGGGGGRRGGGGGPDGPRRPRGGGGGGRNRGEQPRGRRDDGENREREEQGVFNKIVGLFSQEEIEAMQEAREQALRRIDEELSRPEPPLEMKVFLENHRKGFNRDLSTDYFKSLLRKSGYTEKDLTTRSLEELLEEVDRRAGEFVTPTQEESARIREGLGETEGERYVKLLEQWRNTNADPGTIDKMISQNTEPTPDLLKRLRLDYRVKIDRDTRIMSGLVQMGVSEEDARRLLELGFTPDIVRRRLNETEKPPLEPDILEKLIKFYAGYKLNKKLIYTQAQAEEQARKWFDERELPQGEELFNPVGFIQEIISERVKEIDEAGNNQKDGMVNALRTRLTRGGTTGDLRALIDVAIKSSIDPRDRAQQYAAETYTTRLNDILEATQGNIHELERRLNAEIFTPIHGARDRLTQEARGYKSYGSITEVALDIMLKFEEFGRNGKYALIKTENGKEVLQKDNFIRWLRKSMIFAHENDVDNQVNMWQAIYVSSGFRQVSVGELVESGRDGGATFRDIENGWMEDLWEESYYELWLVNKSRNYHAGYRKPEVMGSDEQLPKFLAEVYGENTFTKEKTLQFILSLPSVGEGKAAFDSEGKLDKSNFSTGQAVRRALATFYHIGDREMLERIEADEKGQTPLFNNATYERLWVEKELDKDDGRTREAIEKEFEEKMKQSKTRKFFIDKEATARNNGVPVYKDTVNEEDMADYMEAFNLFNSANKDFDLVNEAKERIRLMIMDQEKISYDEVYYAEMIATTMTRWSGLAARHDYLEKQKRGFSAYDAWTKVLDTQAYRYRQGDENSGGIQGVPYTTGGFKRLGIDFFAGAKDLDDRSIIEIIQGGQGPEIDLEKPVGDIKFGDRIMEKFGTDHIARIFKVYHDVIETNQAGFDKIVSIEKGTGRVIFEPKAANEWIDNFLKAMRYSYRTWAGTDYSKLIRARDRNGVVQTMSIAESLWGAQVYRDFVTARVEEMSSHELQEFTASIQRELEDEISDYRYLSKPEKDRLFESKLIGTVIQDNRSSFWKEPLMYSVAAEMLSHRDFDSGFRKYNQMEFQKIYDWLGSFSGLLDFDEDDMRKTKRDPNKMFFSNKQLNVVREKSDTKAGWLLFEETATQGGLGLLEGLFKAGQILVGGSLK